MGGRGTRAGWRQSTIAMGGQSIGSEVAATVTHNSDSDSQLVLGRGARQGLGSRRTRYTVGGHKKRSKQNIRVVSGRRRGGSVLARERKGSGSSHSGEWRGRGVLSGAREKATLVTCTIDTPPLRDVHVDREKISEPLLSRSSCLQLAGRPRCL